MIMPLPYAKNGQHTIAKRGLRRLSDAVFLEPGEHQTPGILGRVGIVARPAIGVEVVLRVGIDLEFADLAGVRVGLSDDRLSGRPGESREASFTRF
jgi:hypothetical protein